LKDFQLGISELLIQLALYEAGWQGRIVAYVLPTQDLRNRFVGNRIDPLLRDVPAYRARLPSRQLEQERGGESGNLRVKRFGSGQMLFLSAQTDGDFVEFSTDTLIVDEYDLCWNASSSNLSKAKDRLREGDKPRMIRLGNPEMSRTGIEKLFGEGDGREWHWRCGSCGCFQSIDWEQQVVEREDNGTWRPRDPVAAADPSAEIRPICVKCRKPFERRAEGALWVPSNPGRRRSYRMTRWDSMRESLRFVFNLWVAAQASTLELRSWWRANAGRAWEPITGAVTRDQILAAAVLPPIDYSGGDVYLGRVLTSGVDVGSLFNVVVTELVRGQHGRVERRAVLVCTVETEDQVLDIWSRYNVDTAVVDIGPERRISAKLRDEGARIDCNVWLCEFHPGPKTSSEQFAMRLDWLSRRVMVDRTQIFDAATDAIRDGSYLGQTLVEAIGRLWIPLV
jgi:phage terminase large subunit GpA-like protein